MRRRKKPEKATKKEPWLDGPKALVISTTITATVELIKHFLKQKWGEWGESPKAHQQYSISRRFCHERQEEILECGLLVIDRGYLGVLHLEMVLLERRQRMNELEKTALNEVLRTVRLINQKVAEVVELQSQQELAISYLRGIMDGSVSD